MWRSAEVAPRRCRHVRSVEEETPPPELAQFSSLELNEWTVKREEGRAPLVGCIASGKWLEVGEEGVAVVEALAARGSIQRAEDELRARTGEAYDVLAFAKLLRARGFVKAIDGVPLAEGESAKRRHRILYRASPRALRWLHAPAFMTAMAAIVVAYVALLVALPAVRPAFADLAPTGRPMLNLVLVFGASLLFTYVHELAHFGVARSYGVDARIRLGTRLYVPILETDVTNAWMLRPGQRLPIFLGGIVLDLALAAACGFLLAGFETGVLPVVHTTRLAALRLVVAVQFLAVAYQFLFYMRTDLYYVLLTTLGERNLLRDSRAYLGLLARRVHFRLKGAVSSPCAACGSRTYAAEPFCVQCGKALPVEDPNRYPIRFDQRRRLVGWGLVFFVGRLYGLTLGLALALLFLLRQLLLAWVYTEGGLASGSPLVTAEGALAVAVAGAQLAWLLWFLVADAARTLRRVAGRLRLSRAVS